MGRDTALLETSAQFFEHILAPGDSGGEKRRVLLLQASRCVRINALYKGRKVLGVRVAKNRFGIRVKIFQFCSVSSSLSHENFE